MKKLPIGIQTINKILTEGYVYVDKTEHARRLIKEGSPYYFMSRPRRFGKSLFLSTLKEIFKGNKELFEGCAIYSSDYDWREYPVVHLDFAGVVSSTPQELEISLKTTLELIAEEHGVSIIKQDIKIALRTLIMSLSKQYKNGVVVLVDEYDKSLIDQLSNLEIANKNKRVLQGFFETLKTLDPYLRFTFVTGISKFAQVSLFSSFNHLRDLTMNGECADMMGYTREELKTYFAPHIQAIAQERGDQSEEDILEEIREWYNGYRFSEKEAHVYNPFSILNFLQDKRAKSYWYNTGTPTFLLGELKKHPESMVPLDGTMATDDELMGISHPDKMDLIALMYQSGYFTIQNYIPASGLYQLGLPNEEVRRAFAHSLVKNFSPMTNLRASEKYVKMLEEHRPDLLFKHIELGLSSFAYQVFVDAKERTYQAILLSMLFGMGFNPLSEQATNTGRIDVVLEIPKTTYIVELKLNDSAEKALKQIYEKRYFNSYTHKGKQIVVIGANFSSELKNISDWKGELLSPSGEKIKDLFPEK